MNTYEVILSDGETIAMENCIHVQDAINRIFSMVSSGALKEDIGVVSVTLKFQGVVPFDLSSGTCES